jgi:anthraniloyl-CoA monooxygenase
VALSDRTLRGLAVHDPRTHRRIIEASAVLSGVEVRLSDARLRYDGFGFSAISRHTLLTILRDQAEEVGARLNFRHEASADEFDVDIIAFADGATSGHRTARRETFGTSVRTGSAHYVWLGTSAGFGDVAAMAFVRTEYGPMAAHFYPYGAGMSTVVVETDDAAWRNAGLDSSVLASGEIDGDALNLLTEIFADHLGGRRLVSNKSRWGTFNVVRNERWSHGNVVLLGDAAHTAHFTVASGTTMALEDAIALAAALCTYDDHATAFAAYEHQRRGPVARIQGLAEPSMSWWETYGRRMHLPPAQFGLHFITRTVAVSYLGLRRRCGGRIDDAEAAYRREAGVDPRTPPQNAIAAPLRLGEVRLLNRLVTVLPGPAAGAVQPIQSGLVLLREDAPVPRPGPADVAVPTGRVLGRFRPAGWPAPARAAGTGSTGNGALLFVELACPDGPEWTEAADDLVGRAGLLRERGAAGVLLRAATFAGASRWDETLRHASRIRTEVGMAVVVCVPADWALDLTWDADVDSWPIRIHMALISGRVDLIAAWPPHRDP